MSKLTLETPIDQVLLIGPAYSRRLKKLNIFTVEDLLHHYPSRHQDLTQSTIKGKIVSCKNLYTRTGKQIQKAVIRSNGKTFTVTWFNQPFLAKVLTPNTRISLSNGLTSPEYEIIRDRHAPLIHTGRLVPVYPETAGVSSKWLRSRIKFLLDNLKLQLKTDWLPESITTKHRLIDLSLALQSIHFPENQAQINLAVRRLSFDEMFLLQLEALIRHQTWQEKKLSHRLVVDQEKVLNFISHLPFTLTAAQNRCLKDILTDLNRNLPMNRLLQGDVGSGKTVVAAVAMYINFLNGLSSALMAPTEILARQHFNTLKTVFADTGIKLQLITSATSAKGRSSSGRKPDIYIGTHALLFRRLDFTKLSLIVIDEQHRFGVKQRSQLVKLGSQKTTPHLLTMTATPIPRTIALTAYADLDLSVLDEMPQGRLPVKTWVVPAEKRLDAYHWLQTQIKTHASQAFIVCPLIDPSEAETMSDIKAVTQEFNQLKSVFPDLKLDLLHGRLKADEKNLKINAFKANQTQILVATPVIEVGIDMPNATIMVIEAAERFGLAQLHQLRGRVGRSDKLSYCLLFTTHRKANLKRLKYLETINAGLKLAEIDLRLRGPGDLYGLKQHGWFNLKLASFTDTQLVTSTKAAAKAILNHLTRDLKRRLKQRTITSVSPN